MYFLSLWGPGGLDTLCDLCVCVGGGGILVQSSLIKMSIFSKQKMHYSWALAIICNIQIL